MRRLILDGREMRSREALHLYLAQTLAMPSYYGANLDALHDILTEIGEETELVVTNTRIMMEMLGAYGELLLRVLQDSEQENPFLRVILQ